MGSRAKRELALTARILPMEAESAVNPSAEERGVFEHAPLREDSIRLLRLTNYENSRPQCEVEHFHPGDYPEYSALSYTWGDPSWNASVCLNDQQFNVTPNLHAFLKEAWRRHEKGQWKSTWLWIDAICINQADNSERNRCVASMKDIFEGASKIICWLGSDIEISPRLESWALWCLDHLEKLFTRGRSLEINDINDVDVDALRLVFRASWWTRAWIVQEASTPKPPGCRMIWLGSHERSFEHVSHANQVLSAASNKSWEYHRKFRITCPSLDVLEKIREARIAVNEGSGKLRLYEVLPHMRMYEATDQRDKVFALYPICTDVHDTVLKPDYSLPTETLWLNVASHYLKKDDDLDILGHCSHSTRSEGVPSWVPDWSAHQLPVPFVHRNDLDAPMYNACRDTQPLPEINPQDQCLLLRGIIFDRIRHVGRARKETPMNPDVDVFQTWNLLMELLSPIYVTGKCSNVEAYQTTLCADINPETGNRPGSVQLPRNFDGTFDHYVLHKLMHSHRYTIRRKLAITEKGYIGLVPAETERGDLVCVLYGGQMPFILRAIEGSEKYELIGEAYVHGIMDGEALREGIEEQNFKVGR